MQSHPAAEEASESHGLVEVSLEEVPRSHINRRRQVVVGTTLALLAVVGVILKTTLAPCSVSSGLDPDAMSSMVSLAALDRSEGLATIAATERDGDAVAQWLAASNAASSAAASSAMGGGAAARAAVEKALATESPTQARVVVKRAMRRAIGRWQTKRRALKKLLKAKKLGHLKRSPAGRTPAAKAAVAACVFNNLQATTQLAALAVNINDAAKTCTEGSSCGINVANIFYSIGAVATELSFAAANCADTVTTAPNIDALCAGSISAIIQTLAEVAVSAEMIAAGCVPRDVPKGLAPSNIGSAGAPDMFHRRLSTPNATDHAQGRRLLAGGGKGADATFCAIDVASAAWYLAQAGLRINEAGNQNAGATCPPKGKKHGSNEERAAYAVSQAFCSVSVSGALYGFLQAIYFINFAFVHCADELNTRAICGAGVDGLISSTAAVALAGSATFLTCEELQKPAPEDAKADSVAVRRRLSEDAESGVEELKRQFSSPGDVWRSMGFDLDGPSAELRDVQPRQLPSEELLGLVQEPTQADPGEAADKGGMIFGLGGPLLCS